MGNTESLPEQPVRDHAGPEWAETPSLESDVDKKHVGAAAAEFDHLPNGLPNMPDMPEVPSTDQRSQPSSEYPCLPAIKSEQLPDYPPEQPLSEGLRKKRKQRQKNTQGITKDTVVPEILQRQATPVQARGANFRREEVPGTPSSPRQKRERRKESTNLERRPLSPNIETADARQNLGAQESHNVKREPSPELGFVAEIVATGNGRREKQTDTASRIDHPRALSPKATPAPMDDHVVDEHRNGGLKGEKNAPSDQTLATRMEVGSGDEDSSPSHARAERRSRSRSIAPFAPHDLHANKAESFEKQPTASDSEWEGLASEHGGNQAMVDVDDTAPTETRPANGVVRRVGPVPKPPEGQRVQDSAQILYEEPTRAANARRSGRHQIKAVVFSDIPARSLQEPVLPKLEPLQEMNIDDPRALEEEVVQQVKTATSDADHDSQRSDTSTEGSSDDDEGAAQESNSASKQLPSDSSSYEDTSESEDSEEESEKDDGILSDAHSRGKPEVKDEPNLEIQDGTESVTDTTRPLSSAGARQPTPRPQEFASTSEQPCPSANMSRRRTPKQFKSKEFVLDSDSDEAAQEKSPAPATSGEPPSEAQGSDGPFWSDGGDLVDMSPPPATASSSLATSRRSAHTPIRRAAKPSYFEREEGEIAKASEEVPSASAKRQARRPSSKALGKRPEVSTSRRGPRKPRKRRESSASSREDEATPVVSAGRTSTVTPSRVRELVVTPKKLSVGRPRKSLPVFSPSQGSAIQAVSMPPRRSLPALEASPPPPLQHPATPVSEPQDGAPRVSGMFTRIELDRMMNVYTKFREDHNMSPQELNALIQGRTDDADPRTVNLWSRMRAACPGRSRAAVAARARKIFHNFAKHGKFTKEEDQELTTLVRQYGTKWASIGQLIDRHPEEIRKRWENYLICATPEESRVWEDYEESRLVELVMQALTSIQASRGDGISRLDESAERAIPWRDISTALGTRGISNCRRRWYLLRRRTSMFEVGTETAEFVSSTGPFQQSEPTPVPKGAAKAARMTNEDKYLLVRAIRDSDAGKDKNIPWTRLVNRSWRRKWGRAAIVETWKRLQEAVPRHEFNSVRKNAQFHLDRWAEHGLEADPLEMDLVGEDDDDEADLALRRAMQQQAAKASRAPHSSEAGDNEAPSANGTPKEEQTSSPTTIHRSQARRSSVYDVPESVVKGGAVGSPLQRRTKGLPPAARNARPSTPRNIIDIGRDPGGGGGSSHRKPSRQPTQAAQSSAHSRAVAAVAAATNSAGGNDNEGIPSSKASKQKEAGNTVQGSRAFMRGKPAAAATDVADKRSPTKRQTRLSTLTYWATGSNQIVDEAAPSSSKQMGNREETSSRPQEGGPSQGDVSGTSSSEDSSDADIETVSKQPLRLRLNSNAGRRDAGLRLQGHPDPITSTSQPRSSRGPSVDLSMEDDADRRPSDAHISLGVLSSAPDLSQHKSRFSKVRLRAERKDVPEDAATLSADRFRSKRARAPATPTLPSPSRTRKRRAVTEEIEDSDGGDGRPQKSRRLAGARATGRKEGEKLDVLSAAQGRSARLQEEMAAMESDHDDDMEDIPARVAIGNGGTGA